MCCKKHKTRWLTTAITINLRDDKKHNRDIAREILNTGEREGEKFSQTKILFGNTQTLQIMIEYRANKGCD